MLEQFNSAQKPKEGKKKKGCMWVIISIIIIAGIGAICSAISDKKNANIKAEIEECIEKEDFVKAKKLQKKLDYDGQYGLKICRAQVSSLISKGEYELASDIAREDGDCGIYVNIILDRLSSIYNKDKQSLSFVISTLSFPIMNEYGVYWDGNRDYYGGDDMNVLISKYNEALASVIKLAINNDDKSTVTFVSNYLLPQYKIVKYKKLDWDVKLQKNVYVDAEKYEDTPTDYTEANKIKKQFGIK